jgi:cardiolipin synthase
VAAHDELADSRLPRLASATLGAPLLSGNHLDLLSSSDSVFQTLIEEIDAAQVSCDLQFYIWAPGGRVDQVAAALKRAAARKVRCRVLVDALGSSHFLRGGAANDLEKHGVDVHAALTSGLLSLVFVRPDLRLHRKIVVIDHRVGFTGSMNMADPRTFKQEAGVGEWVDAMVRIEGPAVLALAASFLSFWSVESGEKTSKAEWVQDARRVESKAGAGVQVLASGPALRVEAIEQFVLRALYEARREVVLTTPYFVPSESLLTALLSVAGSGVDVTLIVPARVDSRLVHYASRAYQVELLKAGVKVALYEGGLLHTKSITVDDDLTLFGSLNLDPRSLRLNFEITLSVYDREFHDKVRALQQSYLANSTSLDLTSCEARSPAMQFLQNSVRLLGPVL